MSYSINNGQDDFISTQFDDYGDGDYSIMIDNETILHSDNSRVNSDNNKEHRKVNEASLYWGLLRRKGGDEYSMTYRVKDQRRDTFVLGRNRSSDIFVDDSKVSSTHCLIYCDYSQARLRVFVEDTSANGTFVNDSLTRLTKGERLELKSGDEIFLTNPRNIDSKTDHKPPVFMFINLRERLVDQRMIALAPSIGGTNLCRHVEDFYIIGDQIGSGMCGQVHLCIHRETSAQCAVKIIDTKKFALTPGLSPKDLIEEANLMKILDHPNIIRVIDNFETDHVLFIVMELVTGGDLFDRIVERGRYTETMARLVMEKILSAVSYLHSKDIIHRDLKPENILLVDLHDDIDIKITDFGLAKRTNQEGLKTFCGTPQYFAPEVLSRKSSVSGSGRYGTSADMWSLGVVLYILLSGTFPFDDDNLFDQIQRAHYSFSGSEWASISDSAKHLVRSMMTLIPDKRISVENALIHPWMTGEPLSSLSLSQSTFNKVNKAIPKVSNNSESLLNSKSFIELVKQKSENQTQSILYNKNKNEHSNIVKDNVNFSQLIEKNLLKRKGTSIANRKSLHHINSQCEVINNKIEEKDIVAVELSDDLIEEYSSEEEIFDNFVDNNNNNNNNNNKEDLILKGSSYVQQINKNKLESGVSTKSNNKKNSKVKTNKKVIENKILSKLMSVNKINEVGTQIRRQGSLESYFKVNSSQNSKIITKVEVSHPKDEISNIINQKNDIINIETVEEEAEDSINNINNNNISSSSSSSIQLENNNFKNFNNSSGEESKSKKRQKLRQPLKTLVELFQ